MTANPDEESVLCSVDHGQQVWAVVRTKPRRERLAHDRITSRGYAAYLPMVMEKYKTRGMVSKPLFPSYLFVRIVPRRDLLTVRWTPGVSRVLGHGDRLICIDDPAIECLRTQEKDRKYLENTVKRRFARNDRVAIRSGPLRGLQGVFQGYLSGAERVRLLLDYVHYQHEVEMDRSLIARV